VTWGLEHRNLDGVTAIGVDEISRGRGQNKYVTLVYQIDSGARRLLWVGKERTKKALEGFFDAFGAERSQKLAFVCSDMWKPSLDVVAQKAGQAVHVLDRFHVMAKMSAAIDDVRAKEVKQLKAKNKQPLLAATRWCLLKRPENLTEAQEIKLKELLATSRPSGPTCSRKISSSSGATFPRRGRASSSTPGAGGRCARDLRR
jgi:transposase